LKTKRALFFRLGVILFLIAVSAIMMVIGRGHTVYFDSKKMEYEGKTYESPYRIDVYVKGERVARLNAGERGMTTWIGQNFKMELEITQIKGGEKTTSSHSIKLPYNMDGIIINLPAYLAGLPEAAYLEQFVPAVVVEETEEIPVIDEFEISTGE
jgi:hypothetical protein